MEMTMGSMGVEDPLDEKKTQWFLGWFTATPIGYF